MPIRTRRAVIAAAGTLLAAAAARKLHAQEDGSSGGGEGLPDLSGLRRADPPQALPAFGFTDADGHPKTIADYAGVPVVLNFWATWCHPCVAEMPSLDGLAQKLRGSGIQVLPLSSDRGGASTIRRFYATHQIQTLPVLLDPDMAAAHAFNVRGVPTTILIDGQGRECARLEGAADWNGPQAAEQIRTLLAGKPAAPETQHI